MVGSDAVIFVSLLCGCTLAAGAHVQLRVNKLIADAAEGVRATRTQHRTGACILPARHTACLRPEPGHQTTSEATAAATTYTQQ